MRLLPCSLSFLEIGRRRGSSGRPGSTSAPLVQSETISEFFSRPGTNLYCQPQLSSRGLLFPSSGLQELDGCSGLSLPRFPEAPPGALLPGSSSRRCLRLKLMFGFGSRAQLGRLERSCGQAWGPLLIPLAEKKSGLYFRFSALAMFGLTQGSFPGAAN